MPAKDLFGQAFLDFYEGKKYPSQIERDDGYVDDHDIGQYFNACDKFPDAEKKALRHAKGRVLDIGVGAGRHSLYLQEKGLDVVGIDISDKALEVCRRRGVRKLRKMSACDLRFKRDSFDSAMAFCNNFGLCGSMKGVQGMLTRLHRIISDDGVFLAESVHPTDTRKRAHLRYHKMNIARGRPPGQVRIRIKYKGKAGEWFDLLMVTPEEMRELCDRTGWRIARTYKGAPMYVYVLKKA
jgi:cyclopropane fatty-acyl-phospholipid synthase-like methyltransferase